ncbi:hypothetical protein [Bradyrhizobium sp. 5.13L]
MFYDLSELPSDLRWQHAAGDIYRHRAGSLSTHIAGAPIRHSRPPKPGGSCGGSDFHNTSKGAGSLDMIEIEIERLAGKMPVSLIDDLTDRAARLPHGNGSGMPGRSRIKWMFAADKARAEVG